MVSDTCLLVAAGGLDEAALVRRLPLGCLESGVGGLEWEGGRGDWRCELRLPEGMLGGGQTVLPSFSAPGYRGGFCFDLLYEDGDGEGVCSLAAVGDEPLPGVVAQKGVGVGEAVDIFEVKRPLRRGILRLRLGGDEPPARSLLAVSLARRTGAVEASGGAGKVDILVPAKSQRLLAAELAPHVCSPTSVSMVLDYYGRQTDAEAMAGHCRHRPSGLYGVWPANVYAAGGWDVVGYLCRFGDWDTARGLLDAGLPLITSIRFEAGQLDGAPIKRTAGHLVVLRGYDGGQVLVNDPAADTLEGVPRRYDRAQFCRAWLGGSGVGYVLFPLEQVAC